MAKEVDPKGSASEVGETENDLPPTRKDVLRLEAKIKEQEAELLRLRRERPPAEVPPAGKKKVAKADKPGSIFSEDWEDDDADDEAGEEE